MRVEFAYAGARAQARLGQRPSADNWHMLHSSRGLPQYLHTARRTVLSRYVRHFAPSSSPHAIERSLRRDWRAEVDAAARWLPRRWRDAVLWTAALPDLAAIVYLIDSGKVLPWMVDDPVLSAFAMNDADARRQAVLASRFAGLASMNSDSDPLEWWLQQWRARWPTDDRKQTKLPLLVAAIKTHAVASRQRDVAAMAPGELRNDLEKRVIRLMRTEHQRPVAVFCHLLLTALDFLTLRSGLIRRSLFNDPTMRRAS